MNVFVLALIAYISATGAAEAGPIAGMFAAIGTWIGTTLAAGGMGAFLLRTAAGMALSALGAMMQKKPNMKSPGVTTETTTTGGTTSQRLIFGTYATAGHLNAPWMVYETDSDPNEWLVGVYVLADKPVTGLDTTIIINGVEYEIVGNPAASANGNAMGVTVRETDQNNLENKVFIRFHDGRQSTVDAYLMRVFAGYPERPWAADMVGRGVAYAVLTFKGKAEDSDYQGMPTVNFIVHGHAVYDPRDPTQNPNNENTWKFSENPAILGFNIIRGIPLYGNLGFWGVGARSFNLSSIIAAANLCDERPEGTYKRYVAGLEIALEDEPGDALEAFLEAMGGSVGDMGGTWSIFAGEPAGSVFALTDTDISTSDSQSVNPYPGLDSTYNAVHATYPDRDQLWKPKEAVPLYNAGYEAADGGRRLPAEIDYKAVVNHRQVRALMREILADHRRMRTHVITLPPDSLAIGLGDHITWNSEINGYVNKVFRVTSMGIDPDSLFLTLSIVERDPNDYNPNFDSDSLVPYRPSSEIVTPVIQGVAGWNAYAVDVGGKPGIRIEWDSEINARAISWIIRLDSDRTVINSGDVVNIGLGYVIVTAGLKPLTDYRVAGRLVLNRETTISQEILVRTLNLGIEWAEFSQEVTDYLNAMEEMANQARLRAQEAIANLGAISNLIDEEVENLQQLAMDNLLVAQNYTDTEIVSESVARQDEIGSLAARVDSLSAVSTGDNLLVNGNFADGVTGWTGLTATPAGKATVTSAGANQYPEVLFAVGELLQWRVEHNGPAGQVRIAFRNSSNVQIGQAFVTNLPASTNPRVASGQHTPPAGTVSVNFRVTGTGVVLDNASMTTIDQQTIARIENLEAVHITDTAALATHVTNTNARFGTNEASINTARTTLANLNGSVAMLDTSVVAGEQRASIKVGAWNNTTGGMTPGSAIMFDAKDILFRGSVAMDHLAVGTGKNLMIDPTFEDGTTHYIANHYLNSGTMAMRGPGGGWSHPAFPTIYIIQSSSASTGYQEIHHQPWVSDGQRSPGVPAKPGVRYCLSVQPSMHNADLMLILYWVNASGGIISASTRTFVDIGTGGSSNNADIWPRRAVFGIAPAGTVYCMPTFRKHGTKGGAANSHMFLWKPQLEETTAFATEPSAWSPGGTTMINGGRLFADSVGARHITSETMRALNGRFTTLAAGNIRVGNAEITTANIQLAAINTARIADLSVNTIKIANNSVTVQWSANAGSVSFSLTQAAKLIIVVYAEVNPGSYLQGSENNRFDAPTLATIKLNGGAAWSRNFGGGRYTYMHTLNATAGATTVALDLEANWPPVSQDQRRPMQILFRRIAVFGAYK